MQRSFKNLAYDEFSLMASNIEKSIIRRNS
jgi:hypothetical protein